MNIHHDKCNFEKREMTIAFEHEGDEYVFVYNEDDFQEELGVKTRLTRNGVRLKYKPYSCHNPFIIIEDYKYNLQAALKNIGSRGYTLFIDRRYEHGEQCDIYFGGRHYVAGDQTKPNYFGEEE